MVEKEASIRETILFETLNRGAVRCGICPHRCEIAPGASGICSTRKNIGGKLYSVIYGLISSVAIDPIEKKPLFHFHPGSRCLSLGSYGCNLQCIHCQNWSIAHVRPSIDERAGEFLSPLQSMRLAQEERVDGLCWTYNEPTIWLEYMIEGAQLARQGGFYTAVVTNGYITPEALALLAPNVDAYRVDLKGWNPSFWRKIANISDPKPIFEAARLARKSWNLHVEVVTNVIPTYNDDDATFHQLAGWIRESLGPETPWHVTRFIPYLALSHLPATPLSTLEHARQIGLEEGLEYVYLGNVPTHPAENTLCPRCGSLLIERSGYRILRNTLEQRNQCPRCHLAIPIIGAVQL